ncbi:hypothetical protein Taci_0164 [Thermanaerovibrio acidaminovorans DSM 6589]|uniref:Outer membrane efflux protein n=1 Tax=Thermanaerovibrio acidaminovorans (strain ATCC 49978 / DSM 6589 / Su883) TaxID=525903 RepID=D1B801_THEAS|nr:TolC family protein [Thermanaerovibrio acidaminovorans]ACZ18404.1 hypothetical protein Taci_0164 [Thermanaerovibrio acidaminovorans DSM 6589]
MTSRPVRSFLLALSLAILCQLSPQPSMGATLPELEEMVSSSPEVLRAVYDLLALQAREEALVASSGLKFFAEASVTGSNRPESRSDDARLEGYSTLSGRVGLALPVLGSWHRERVSQIRARIDSLKGAQREMEARRANLTALRKAYVLLWTSQRRELLSRWFLRLEGQAMPPMRRRTEEGYLLKADLLEMESWFHLARRQLEGALADQEMAMGIIRKATGRPYQEILKAETPSLRPVRYSKGALGRYVNQDDPELGILQQVTEQMELAAHHQGRGGYEAEVRAGVSYSLEDPGRGGHDAFVSFGLTAPVGLSKASRLSREAALFEAQAAAEEEAIHRMDRLSSILHGVSRCRHALSQLEFSSARLESALEALRVADLRASSIPGDVLERRLRAQMDLFSAAMDVVEAEGLAMQYHAELLELIPQDGPQEDPVVISSPPPGTSQRWALVMTALGGTPSPRGQSTGALQLGAYLWNGDRVLNGEGDRLLELIGRSPFRRILISFTSRGIRSILDGGPASRRLHDFLRSARSSGVWVELLLGDPDFILDPKGMVDLISRLKGLPFDGLHLDLEVDQIPGASQRRQELNRRFLQAVEAAAKASPWGVSVSIHPRYLEEPFRQETLEGLHRSRVRGVAVMIYTSSTDRAVERFLSVARGVGDIRMWLAVSVEGNVSPEESLRGLGPAGFSDALDRMGRAGVRSVLVQSFEDHLSMTGGGGR